MTPKEGARLGKIECAKLVNVAGYINLIAWQRRWKVTTADTSKPALLQGLEQWIDYIRYSLADIVVRGEWSDFGLFRFLNRISFMSRNQLVFVIHRPEDPDSRNLQYIVDEEISAFDPFFKNQLFDTMEAYGFISRPVIEFPFGASQAERKQSAVRLKRAVEHNALGDYLIRMFDTKNILIAFELKIDKTEPGRPPTLIFTPIKRASSLGEFLVRVLLPFDGKDGRMLLHDGVEPHFAKLRAGGAYKRAIDDKPEKQNLSRQDLEQIAKLSTPVVSIVEKEYKRLALSPLLRSFLNSSADTLEAELTAPANIFFFSKTFCRKTTRFGFYFYEPVFLLGEHQSDLLMKALGCAKREDLIPYPSPERDDQFWHMLSSKDGPRRVHQMLRSPLSKHVRLFTENALMSGTTMIEPDIFERGGIGWIARATMTKQEEDAAFLHLICLHYVLQLGSPKRPADASNLSIVSLPFRCSGGIWMCASFLRENISNEYPGLINQRGFEEAYVVYHSLLRESERRIRRKAKFAYLEEIGRLAAAAARAAMQRHRHFGTDLHLDQYALDAFNQASRNLARIYPFPHTLLEADSPSKRDLLRSSDVVITDEDNPFFDRLTLRSFLELEDIAQEIHNRMMLEAATPEVR